MCGARVGRMTAEASRIAVSDVSIALSQRDTIMDNATRVQNEGWLFERLVCASSRRRDKHTTVALSFDDLRTVGRACTAFAETRTTDSVQVVLWQPTPEARRRLWQCLAYAFFVKHARARSSVTKLELRGQAMGVADAEAIADVLESDDPAYLLFGRNPLGSADESDHQGVTRRPDVGVVPKGTAVRLEQVDARDEFRDELVAWVLESDVGGVRVLDDLDGDFVRALIPGYGVCRVPRESITPERHVPDQPPPDSRIVEFSAGLAAEDGSLDGVVRFYELIGASLTSVWIGVRQAVPSSDLLSILRSCPNLTSLAISGSDSCVSTASFLKFYRATDVRLAVLQCQFDDVHMLMKSWPTRARGWPGRSSA